MKQQPLFEVPQWIPEDAWTGFVDMRKKIRKPLTDRGRICIINTLWRMKGQGYDPGSVLDQSTVNCWLDVYPIRQNGNGRKGNGKHSLIEAIRNSGTLPDFE